MDIILASASPRRKQILENSNIKFKICPSDYDEKLTNLTFSKEKIEEIALNKAKTVAQKYPNNIIISADTVVVLENKIFTKPKNKTAAKKMLKLLSGKTHFVQTSVCIIYSKQVLLNSTISYVKFNKLSDELINNYVEKFNPTDKAGAYGIQELPEGFINSIEGDYENIMGISSKVIKRMLRNIIKPIL